MILAIPAPHNYPLASPDAIADWRASAATAHYPLSRVRPLQADAMAATRAAHIAATAGDAAAEVAARTRVLDLGERIDEELDRAADTGLAMLALALDRRPHELADLLHSGATVGSSRPGRRRIPSGTAKKRNSVSCRTDLVNYSSI